MPGFNGTGPMGFGPMTGGGRGFCGGAYPDYYRPRHDRHFRYGRGFRRGFGQGTGGGHGYGRSFGWRSFYSAGGDNPLYENPSEMNPKNELQLLQNETAVIKNNLEGISRHIEKLKSKLS